MLLVPKFASSLLDFQLFKPTIQKWLHLYVKTIYSSKFTPYNMISLYGCLHYYRILPWPFFQMKLLLLVYSEQIREPLWYAFKNVCIYFFSSPKYSRCEVEAGTCGCADTCGFGRWVSTAPMGSVYLWQVFLLINILFIRSRQPTVLRHNRML